MTVTEARAAIGEHIEGELIPSKQVSSRDRSAIGPVSEVHGCELRLGIWLEEWHGDIPMTSMDSRKSSVSMLWTVFGPSPADTPPAPSSYR